MKRILLTATTSLASLALIHADEKKSAIDPEVIPIANRAVDYLTAAPHFSVSAEIWQDLVSEDGTKLQFTKTVDIKLRRPNHLRLDISTTTPKRSFFFDGKHLTFLDHQEGYYGTTAAEGSIDSMIDAVDEGFGVTFPLEDILISDSFSKAAKAAKSGRYLGLDPVLGDTCHHLAFKGEFIDWQVWILDGAVPSIRKAVISYNDEESSPQFTAIFSDWDFTTPLPDFLFTYEAPADAMKIEFMTVTEADKIEGSIEEVDKDE